MLTPEFIRHEIDAINEKWHEIESLIDHHGMFEITLICSLLGMGAIVETRSENALAT